jgi:hypothetical protein
MFERIGFILVNGCQLLNLFISSSFHVLDLIFDQIVVLSLFGLPSSQTLSNLSSQFLFSVL